MSAGATNGRVLAFRHVPFEGLGLIENGLRAHGIGFDYADLYLPGSALPDLGDYQGLIFMGGPMSVNDNLPYLILEQEIIRQAFQLRMPVLGVCLGSQLIAKALGGQVRRNPVKEIGWFDIELTEAGRRDPVLSPAGDRETVFHWHSETFELPPGAVLLASSERCLNQAFRLESYVYGLQFHLEVTQEMIVDWCRQEENCADVRELVGAIDPGYQARRLEVLSEDVFGRWCDMMITSQTGGRATLICGP